MTATRPPKATRREWFGLAVIALPCLLYSMDLTVLNLATPHLSADLEPTSSQLLWIVDIYGFLLAGCLVTMGSLGDRIGRRKLLLIGAMAFGAASVLAAFSTSAAMLIAARAVLGIAAATLAPSTLSLIRNMFLDERERTFAIGVWIASFSAGGAIGPLVGGVLLTYFWWGSVFLIAVPIMALLLVLGPIYLPEYRDPEAGRLDIISAALSLVSVLAVIYGIKQAAEIGFNWVTLLSVATGVVFGAMFVRRQKVLREPLIDLELFRQPAFSAALAVNVIGFFVAFSAFLFIAQFLQLVLGLTPFEAGLWSVPSGLAFVAGSMLTPLLVKGRRPTSVMATGFLLAAAGFLVLTRAGELATLPTIIIGYTVFSLGPAPVFTLATDMMVGSVPPEKAGMASGIAETSSEFGGALGIALLGSLVTAIYRSRVNNAQLDGMPVEAVEMARNTLGSAVTAARQISKENGDVLLMIAQDAFAGAVTWVFAVSAAFALLGALLTVLAIGRRHPGSRSSRARGHRTKWGKSGRNA
jgi:DHA2 family multidrug resistance protein-like MFS transporter